VAGKVPETFDAADPAASQPAAVQAAFERLRAAFIAGLPGRWQEIDTAATGPLRRAALHRLAGASGSYGLLALGDAAHRAERLCGAGPSPELVEGQAQALQEVRLLIEGAGFA